MQVQTLVKVLKKFYGFYLKILRVCKIPINAVPFHNTNEYGGVDVYLHSLLFSTLDGSGQLYDSAPVLHTHSVGNWIGSRADLDSLVEKKPLVSAGNRHKTSRSRSPHLSDYQDATLALRFSLLSTFCN